MGGNQSTQQPPPPPRDKPHPLLIRTLHHIHHASQPRVTSLLPHFHLPPLPKLLSKSNQPPNQPPRAQPSMPRVPFANIITVPFLSRFMNQQSTRQQDANAPPPGPSYLPVLYKFYGYDQWLPIDLQPPPPAIQSKQQLQSPEQSSGAAASGQLPGSAPPPAAFPAAPAPDATASAVAGKLQLQGDGQSAPSGQGQQSAVGTWQSDADPRAEVGRATWTLLHTMASQYPDHPTRQQRADVTTLVDLLTRVYPCGECAGHFKELVKRRPVQAQNGEAFRGWVCYAHNVVNQRLGKEVFDCEKVGGRWPRLECGGVGEGSCEMGIGKRK